jgi:nucleoside-diphosphate-sugar epimerase
MRIAVVGATGRIGAALTRKLLSAGHQVKALSRGGPDDARTLLAGGLAGYRREHKTMPARVLLHKTSYFDEG